MEGETYRLIEIVTVLNGGGRVQQLEGVDKGEGACCAEGATREEVVQLERGVDVVELSVREHVEVSHGYEQELQVHCQLHDNAEE